MFRIDISIDERGYARIERVSFNAYNESQYVQAAVGRYYERTGHYPESLLVDQIYRTRDNRAFCKQYGIRMSGPKLRWTTTKQQSYKEKKQEHQDNTDRDRTRIQFGEAQLWSGAYNHKTGDNSALGDCVICIRIESFQDAEKNPLRLYGEMEIILISSRVLCYNTGLI